MQFGVAARATKTCGAYGEGIPNPVSGSVSCNLHPSMYVPMERQECGAHHAMAKERFVVATEEPVQPHAALPSEYTLPVGHKRWKWVSFGGFAGSLCYDSQYVSFGVFNAQVVRTSWKLLVVGQILFRLCANFVPYWCPRCSNLAHTDKIHAAMSSESVRACVFLGNRLVGTE